MSKINKELQLSVKKYNFKKNINGLLVLTRLNVALVETMISYNPKYNKTNNKLAVGSTAYWINQLYKTYDKDTYINIVRAINRENSTRVRKNDCYAMGTFLYNQFSSLNALKLTLAKRKDGIKLVENLKNKTKTYTTNSNYSLATKIVHYLCYNLFNNYKQDNYSIYDKIVSNMIPTYASAYSILVNTKKFNDYKYYSDIIDQVIKTSGNKISRNGFDHLLWYVK